MVKMGIEQELEDTEPEEIEELGDYNLEKYNPDYEPENETLYPLK